MAIFSFNSVSQTVFRYFECVQVRENTSVVRTVYAPVCKRFFFKISVLLLICFRNSPVLLCPAGAGAYVPGASLPADAGFCRLPHHHLPVPGAAVHDSGAVRQPPPRRFVAGEAQAALWHPVRSTPDLLPLLHNFLAVCSYFSRAVILI
jgi:hypothetical protein